MSESHGIKDGATGEGFQEQWCLWERGAPVGGEVDLFNLQDLSTEVYFNRKFASFIIRGYYSELLSPLILPF